MDPAAIGPLRPGPSTLLRSGWKTTTSLVIAHSAPRTDKPMATTSNRLFDEIARLATDAAGAAQGVRREVETVVRSQAERLIRDMDVASREEVEVLREMVLAAREENERLGERLKALEERLDAPTATPNPPGP